MTTITVALDHLSELVLQALHRQGLNESAQQAVHDVLMYAQKRNSSQGIIKIVERTTLPDSDSRPVKISQRCTAIAAVDGGGQPGMLVMQRATGQAIEMVESNGLALVTTSNTRSSTGSIGFYARQFAERGYIGIVLAGSPKVMALEGGIDPVLGTNPVAIAIPTGSSPLVLDMATAATTWFAVINARDNNHDLPDGVAIDKNGQPTLDAATALSGALRTFGGAKGSGLALMFELLTAPLAGASVFGDSKDNRANTLIGINPAAVLNDDSYPDNVDVLLNRIRQSRSEQGPVRLPGEHSDAVAEACDKSNSITLDAGVYNAVRAIADS